MKRIITALALVCLAGSSMAQDSTSVPQNDTIRVGNMIIIRSGKDRDKSYYDTTSRTFKRKNESYG